MFVKEPVPFPHELEEGDESKSVVVDTNRSQDEGLHTIDLSSDEDVGLEAQNEDEGLEELHELSGEPLERSRADKFKRSSLKKVGQGAGEKERVKERKGSVKTILVLSSRWTA